MDEDVRPNPPPRQALERELNTLIDTYSLSQVVHALIEACYGHSRIRAGESPEMIEAASFQFAAGFLTSLENVLSDRNWLVPYKRRGENESAGQSSSC